MTDESRDGLTYARAGVDIDAGSHMVDFVNYRGRLAVAD
jgi:hypothetical protein